MRKLIRILLALVFSFNAGACIWDAQSLSHEKSRSHDLAQTILGESQIQENTNQLRATLKELEANRKESDVNWWNNLAGTYLRLNRAQDAVNLLEPVVAKFPDDYGMHANLGTAYHLLGRYQDAEKEIARDLQINPQAHFGLEKYHLALLQYLVRDQKYQARHVYVDEYTVAFVINTGSAWDFIDSQDNEGQSEYRARDLGSTVAAESAYQMVLKTNGNRYESLRALATVAASDEPPAYRKDMDLRRDANLEAGVIYMAQMNPKEPACQVMLGIVAWKKQDYHLASLAFERAINLGSPQAELLREKMGDLQEFIQYSRDAKLSMDFVVAVVFGLPAALIVFFILKAMLRKRPRAGNAIG